MVRVGSDSRTRRPPRSPFVGQGRKEPHEVAHRRGALIGGLGGSFGTALQGAAGAGLSAAMAKQLDDIYKGVGSTTGSELLGNIAANVVAGVGGALVGGGMGATTASGVELYNQSMHRKKNDLLTQVCSGQSPCSESQVMAVINAQGANADAAAGTLRPNYVSIGAGSLSGAVGSAINLLRWHSLYVIQRYSILPARIMGARCDSNAWLDLGC